MEQKQGDVLLLGTLVLKELERLWDGSRKPQCAAGSKEPPSGDGNEPRLGEVEAFQREPWALESAEGLPGVSHWSFGRV